MGKAKKVDFNEPVPVFEEEDEATLAAIDRGIRLQTKAELYRWKRSASE